MKSRKPVDVDDSPSERLWGFLRQVMANAASDQPMLVRAGELFGVGGGVRVLPLITKHFG